MHGTQEDYVPESSQIATAESAGQKENREGCGHAAVLLLTSSPDFPNLCISPIPTFFDGDGLIAAQSPRPSQSRQTEVCTPGAFPTLNVPVRLLPDSGPIPSTAALILDTEETVWVRRLVYRLPGEAFGRYFLCLGENGSVLLSADMPLESLPFGISMRQVQDTQLFLPLRARLLPELSWDVLAEVLKLRDTLYTFLLPDARLDLPREAFVPLSKA